MNQEQQQALINNLTRHIDELYEERDVLVSLIARMAQRLGYPVTQQRSLEGANVSADWQYMLVVELPAGAVIWTLPQSAWQNLPPLPSTDIPGPLVTRTQQRKRLLHPFEDDQEDPIPAMHPIGLPPEDCVDLPEPSTEDLEEEGFRVEDLRTNRIPGLAQTIERYSDPTELVTSVAS